MIYTSKEAAEKIGRSTQTLAIWEEQGLITPKRDDRGWRMFTEDDIKIMENIKAQKLQVKLTGKGGEIHVQ